MTNFVKELIKYFHPDNVDTGNGEKFIKLMNQIENDKLEFIVNLSLKDAICGKTLTIGGEQFKIEPCEFMKCNVKKFTAKDGTKFHLRLHFDLEDTDEKLEIKFVGGHTTLFKEVEINYFDALFGGKRINFTIYDNKKYIELKPFIKLNDRQEILCNRKVNGLKLYIRFIIKESEKDKKFIEKMRELYEDCK